MFTPQAFREFERAHERLRLVHRNLSGEKQAATLAKIKVTALNDMESAAEGIRETAKAIAEAIDGDMAKYAAAAIHRAQDAVKAAADDLRAAIDRDLKINEMRD